MNKSLTRSIGFWLLIVLSLASGAVGGWLTASQLTTMTATLLDGSATGVEVYVGQSLAVLGSALIGAGVLGILLAFALLAVRSLLPASAPAALEPIDWSAGESTSATTGDEPSQPEDAQPEGAAEPVVETSAAEPADADLAGSPARS